MKKSFNKTFNWYQKKNVAFFNIELNFFDQFFLYKQIMTGKSYMRATHNLFLKKRLRINNLTGDLGSGGKNDYNKFIFKNLNLVKSFDFYKPNNSTIKINLEKNFNLKKYKLKNIIIFNMFVPIFEKEILLKSISKSLNKSGKLEILFKYFKLNILKIILSPIFIFLNKVFYYTFKDFKNYYRGIHCSCIKIK
jgi:hypothetical protein